jgi:hypothetical protein
LMGRDNTLKYSQNTDEHFQIYRSIGNLGGIESLFSPSFYKTFLIFIKNIKVPSIELMPDYTSFATLWKFLNPELFAKSLKRNE